MEKNRKLNNIRRRLCATLLAFVVAVTMMPAFAFAEELPEQDGNVTETAAAAEKPAENVGQTDAENAADEVTDEDVTAKEVATEEAGATDEKAADEDSGSGLDFGELGQKVPDVSLKDTDDLLSEYIDKQITEETGTALTAPSTEAGAETGKVRMKARLASRASALNDNEKLVYEELKEKVAAIAEGSAVRTDIRVTYYEDADYHLVLNALMTDMPYEFYWYDKTIGYMYGHNAKTFLYLFNVSKEYADSSIVYNDSGFVCGVKAEKARSTKAAVDNVSDIINEFADKSDTDKLYGYRNRICEFATYDRDAVRRSDEYYAKVNSGQSADPFYGDPWQLIYVFDGNAATNVVCEGYSKAFQYLCNRTSFADSGIECHTVTGELYSGTTNRGGHMWNIIHMGNGANYIADVTNSDNGSFARENYFLKGYASGNVRDGYTFSGLTFVYDGETFGGYEDSNGRSHDGMYSEFELTLSDSDYYTGEPAVTHIPEKAATCTASGNIECWLRQGYYYGSEDCSTSSRLTYSNVVTTATGHEWSTWKTTRAATCTSAGTMQRTCPKCGDTESKTIAATGHSWKKTNLLDSYKYRCSRCGKSYSVSKVIVDLPKVSIKKPSRSKASFTAKWKKVSKKNRKKIGGVEIQYSTRRDFASSYTVTTAKKTATSKRFKKLARKRTYYVRVRSYKWINGKKHVSAWSAVKSVKTK